MDYHKIFNDARSKFSKYEGRATQDCHPMDSFDWWIAQEAWNVAIEAAVKVAEQEGYFNGGETIRKLKK